MSTANNSGKGNAAPLGASAPLGSGPEAGCAATGSSAHPWTIERLHGPVSDLLETAEPPASAARLARIHTVTRPGLVLGSTQRLETADESRAAAAGAEILRRRSGGGAVLLRPGSQVWADFFIPASDPLWNDDVAHAAQWVGKLWSAVIGALVAEPVSVHSGRLVADRWGRLVCFAGVGPGEVFVGGLKVVGVSQRRNRQRALIQTTARLRHLAASSEAAHHDLDELELLDVAPADRMAGRAVMATRGGSVPTTEEDLTEALLRVLEAENTSR